MNKYVLYWLTGKAEVVQGLDIASAMNNAGYGNGALRALDFYDNGEDITYTWNSDTKRWEQLEVMTEWEVQEWDRANEEPPYIETVERTEPVKPPKHR